MRNIKRIKLHLGLLRQGANREAVGQIIPQMRRLVVGRVLPRHPHSIDVVVHQGGHSHLRGFDGGKDVESGAVGSVPQNQFLAPVAQQVGLQVGVFLREVARARVVVLVQTLPVDCELRRPVAVPFVNPVAIEQFVLRVAIPIDAEVHRCAAGCCHILTR